MMEQEFAAIIRSTFELAKNQQLVIASLHKRLQGLEDALKAAVGFEDPPIESVDQTTLDRTQQGIQELEKMFRTQEDANG